MLYRKTKNDGSKFDLFLTVLRIQAKDDVYFAVCFLVLF